MPLPPSEPDSADAVRAWIADTLSSRDPFGAVRRASDAHRASHGRGCSVYPTSGGRTLALLAAAIRARRVLELGCGLGYSALWLAHGAGPDGTVETIERDASHAALARRNLAREGRSDRVTVVVGEGAHVLPSLGGEYDLIFSDPDPDEYLTDLEDFIRLLRPGGLLCSSNLFLGQYVGAVGDIRGLDVAAAYRGRILDDERLFTTFFGEMAVSLRR